MTSSAPVTASDVLKDARQLYNAHRASANKPSKVENLDKVWEVLNAIRDDGDRDYSLAEVGRRLGSIGGPKTQSLRNTQGAHYREIITAFANAVSGSTRYVAKTKSNVEQALELITDASIRATIRVALDEAKRLKVTNDNLHAAFKSLQVGASIVPPPPESFAASHAPTKVSLELSPRLRNALSKGIDPSRLAQQGLTISADGGIENEHGDKVFPPAFVLAVQAVLQH